MNTGSRELTEKELTEVTGGDGLLGSVVNNTIDTVSKSHDILAGFSKDLLADAFNLTEDIIGQII